MSVLIMGGATPEAMAMAALYMTVAFSVIGLVVWFVLSIKKWWRNR